MKGEESPVYFQCNDLLTYRTYVAVFMFFLSFFFFLGGGGGGVSRDCIFDYLKKLNILGKLFVFIKFMLLFCFCFFNLCF